MRLSLIGLLLVTGLIVPPALAGGTDFTALSERERAVFHNEIRQVLLSLPDLLPSDRPPAIDPYADQIADDLALIAAHADALFSDDLPGFGAADATHTIALFTAPDCPSCTRAESDLRDLAETHSIRVTLLDFRQNAALTRTLGIDMAPSYVMPDRMLRGHMPTVVLERYIAE